MKRVFSLLLFFVAAMSVQTVQAQTNGDVNGDGKVNEQDIAAILEIMTEAGGVKEQTKYYWYVGQENPASMTSISPIVTSGLGWRYIGETLPTYSSSNKLYDGTTIEWDLDNGQYYWYLMIPVKCNALPRDGAGTDASTVGICEKQGTKTISGVEYQIYKSSGDAFAFDTVIY